MRSLHVIKVIGSSKSRYNPLREGEEAVWEVDKGWWSSHECGVKVRNTRRQVCGPELDTRRCRILLGATTSAGGSFTDY